MATRRPARWAEVGMGGVEFDEIVGVRAEICKAFRRQARTGPSRRAGRFNSSLTRKC